MGDLRASSSHTASPSEHGGELCFTAVFFLHLFCFEDPKSAQETNESLTGGGLVGKQSQAFLSHAANVSVCEVWQTVHALGG